MSLKDRAFVTSNHVAVTPAIHVTTNALPRHGRLLMQVRFKILRSELKFFTLYKLIPDLYDNTGLFYHLVKISDEEHALKINLNINLNGVSNRTDGIEIVDDSGENIVTDGDAAGNVKA